ncbi:hypothetical protein GCM10023196_010030 [Actinoallomurus vinaceus]|uniref:Nickel transporter n=1 Tax=Actinoallomurus vinaceus TaxID=1080074 RepID=A0ABP8U3C5_9ACTN
MTAALLIAVSLLHPLGNFTVNTYDGLVVAPGELRIDHVRDLAEIPTAQAGVTEADLPAWGASTCRQAAAAMRITVDGRPVTATVRSAAASARPGQAGLNTLRLECRIIAPVRAGAIAFRDDGVPGTGWHEVTARGDRMTLTTADVPEHTRSARLTAYPKDMLGSPLDRRTATLRVRAGGPPLADTDGTGAARILPRGADRLTRSFTSLVAHRRLTPGFAALALLISVVLGALHALAPGHGKTIMAAQAVGRGRRAPRDILTLGVTVTVTHTAGVLALGVLVAGGSTLTPAALFPWLGAASGVLVAVAGAVLLRRALRPDGHGHTHHAHGHHDHEHHAHGHGHHVHGRAEGRGRAHTRRRRGSLVLMGFAGGLVPSPSAVVVLVGGAAVGHAWFGVLLVLGYGVGLALMLVSVGLFVAGSGRFLAKRVLEGRLLQGRRLFGRCLFGGRGVVAASAVPAGSAALVVVLGLGIAVRSLGAF